MNRDVAIEAGVQAWQEAAPLLPGMSVGFRRSVIAMVIDAAAPHLVGEPVGWAVIFGHGEVAVVQAEALREAAAAWQVNGWAVDLPEGSSRVALILGMAQRAGDFLRARAGRIERGEQP